MYIPIPTKIDSEMGGAPAQNGIPLVLRTTAKEARSPVVPFSHLFLGEGSPTKIDKKEKVGTQLILTSLLEVLAKNIWFISPC